MWQAHAVFRFVLIPLCGDGCEGERAVVRRGWRRMLLEPRGFHISVEQNARRIQRAVATSYYRSRIVSRFRKKLTCYRGRKAAFRTGQPVPLAQTRLHESFNNETAPQAIDQGIREH